MKLTIECILLDGVVLVLYVDPDSRPRGIGQDLSSNLGIWRDGKVVCIDWTCRPCTSIKNNLAEFVVSGDVEDSGLYSQLVGHR